jgi:hypothetical protein
VRVFENRVLRRIFGLERDEVTGRIHNEKIHNLYSTKYDIIRVIKSNRMRWEGHIARVIP